MPAFLSPEAVRAAVAHAALPGGRPGDVEVRETHISWVFLAGDRAYKLKKPLVLPFLDYSTTERRRHMCEEEVRLNARLAPGLYLGVRGVAADAGLVDAGDPRAVEHVVEMRRFDEADTLAARLARGEVTDEDAAEIGRTLAAFHAGARPVPADGPRVPALERRLAADAHELLAVVDERAEVGRVLALERFAHAWIVAHANVLDARARRGLVREGHGDLRAEHVLLGERVDIVDGIEFDARLREVDVADDLAFLVMDLTARDGGRLVAPLVRAYREAGGDPGSDALLAFHAAHRAMVRAKVALVRAAQLPADEAAHGRETAAARDLLGIAEGFAWRARLPLVLVVCGAPGSGKSHLARALAEASGLAHLDADNTRRSVARGATEATGAGEAAVDADLGRRAAHEVAERGGAIVDAELALRHDRDAFAAAFGAAAPAVLVECLAPSAVRGRRLEQAATTSSVTAPRDPLDEIPAAAHLAVRTDRPVEAILADVLALLDGRLGRSGLPAA